MSSTLVLIYNIRPDNNIQDAKQIKSNPLSLFGVGETKKGIWRKKEETIKSIGINPNELSRELRYVGLRNLGQTCFMNRSALFSLRGSLDGPDVPPSILGPKMAKTPLLDSLQDLFGQLLLSNQMSVNPLRVASTMSIALDEQQDTSEFGAMLLDFLERELKTIDPEFIAKEQATLSKGWFELKQQQNNHIKAEADLPIDTTGSEAHDKPAEHSLNTNTNVTTNENVDCNSRSHPNAFAASLIQNLFKGRTGHSIRCDNCAQKELLSSQNNSDSNIIQASRTGVNFNATGTTASSYLSQHPGSTPSLETAKIALNASLQSRKRKLREEEFCEISLSVADRAMLLSIEKQNGTNNNMSSNTANSRNINSKSNQSRSTGSGGKKRNTTDVEGDAAVQQSSKSSTNRSKRPRRAIGLSDDEIGYLNECNDQGGVIHLTGGEGVLMKTRQERMRDRALIMQVNRREEEKLRLEQLQSQQQQSSVEDLDEDEDVEDENAEENVENYDEADVDEVHMDVDNSGIGIAATGEDEHFESSASLSQAQQHQQVADINDENIDEAKEGADLSSAAHPRSLNGHGLLGGGSIRSRRAAAEENDLHTALQVSLMDRAGIDTAANDDMFFTTSTGSNPHNHNINDSNSSTVNEPVQRLEDILASTFSGEWLEGENAYFCDDCNSKQRAHVTRGITLLPPYLHLNLRRYTYDPITGNRKKVLTPVDFPLELNIAPFCNPASTKVRLPPDTFGKTKTVDSAETTDTDNVKSDPCSLHPNTDCAVPDSYASSNTTSIPAQSDAASLRGFQPVSTQTAGCSECIEVPLDVSSALNGCPPPCMRYRLVGILEHLGGSATSGHYTATLRDRTVSGGPFDKSAFSDTRASDGGDLNSSNDLLSPEYWQQQDFYSNDRAAQEIDLDEEDSYHQSSKKKVAPKRSNQSGGEVPANPNNQNVASHFSVPAHLRKLQSKHQKALTDSSQSGTLRAAPRRSKLPSGEDEEEGGDDQLEFGGGGAISTEPESLSRGDRKRLLFNSASNSQGMISNPNGKKIPKAKAKRTRELMVASPGQNFHRQQDYNQFTSGVLPYMSYNQQQFSQMRYQNSGVPSSSYPPHHPSSMSASPWTSTMINSYFSPFGNQYPFMGVPSSSLVSSSAPATNSVSDSKATVNNSAKLNSTEMASSSNARISIVPPHAAAKASAALAIAKAGLIQPAASSTTTPTTHSADYSISSPSKKADISTTSETAANLAAGATAVATAPIAAVSNVTKPNNTTPSAAFNTANTASQMNAYQFYSPFFSSYGHNMTQQQYAQLSSFQQIQQYQFMQHQQHQHYLQQHQQQSQQQQQQKQQQQNLQTNQRTSNTISQISAVSSSTPVASYLPVSLPTPSTNPSSTQAPAAKQAPSATSGSEEPHVSSCPPAETKTVCPIRIIDDDEDEDAVLDEGKSMPSSPVEAEEEKEDEVILERVKVDNGSNHQILASTDAPSSEEIRDSVEDNTLITTEAQPNDKTSEINCTEVKEEDKKLVEIAQDKKDDAETDLETDPLAAVLQPLLSTHPSLASVPGQSHPWLLFDDSKVTPYTPPLKDPQLPFSPLTSRSSRLRTKTFATTVAAAASGDLAASAALAHVTCRGPRLVSRQAYLLMYVREDWLSPQQRGDVIPIRVLNDVQHRNEAFDAWSKSYRQVRKDLEDAISKRAQTVAFVLDSTKELVTALRSRIYSSQQPRFRRGGKQVPKAASPSLSAELLSEELQKWRWVPMSFWERFISGRDLIDRFIKIAENTPGWQQWVVEEKKFNKQVTENISSSKAGNSAAGTKWKQRANSNATDIGYVEEIGEEVKNESGTIDVEDGNIENKEVLDLVDEEEEFEEEEEDEEEEADSKEAIFNKEWTATEQHALDGFMDNFCNPVNASQFLCPHFKLPHDAQKVGVINPSRPEDPVFHTADVSNGALIDDRHLCYRGGIRPDRVWMGEVKLVPNYVLESIFEQYDLEQQTFQYGDIPKCNLKTTMEQLLQLNNSTSNENAPQLFNGWAANTIMLTPASRLICGDCCVDDYINSFVGRKISARASKQAKKNRR